MSELILGKLNKNRDEFAWFISALFILSLGVFINPWFFIFIVYGLIIKSLGFQPKYFIIGEQIVKLPVGVVKDSVTKQPIPLAVVRLHSKKTNRLLQTRVTNADGKFEFLLPEGSFFIEVNKNGYEFPSKINRYGYSGQDITIDSKMKYSLFKDDIYLDPAEALSSLGQEVLSTQKSPSRAYATIR